VVTRLSDLKGDNGSTKQKTRSPCEQVKIKLQPTNLETQIETESYEEVTQETHFISRRKARR